MLCRFENMRRCSGLNSIGEKSCNHPFWQLGLKIIINRATQKASTFRLRLRWNRYIYLHCMRARFSFARQVSDYIAALAKQHKATSSFSNCWIKRAAAIYQAWLVADQSGETALLYVIHYLPLFASNPYCPVKCIARDYSTLHLTKLVCKYYFKCFLQISLMVLPAYRQACIRALNVNAHKCKLREDHNEMQQPSSLVKWLKTWVTRLICAVSMDMRSFTKSYRKRMHPVCCLLVSPNSMVVPRHGFYYYLFFNAIFGWFMRSGYVLPLAILICWLLTSLMTSAGCPHSLSLSPCGCCVHSMPWRRSADGKLWPVAVSSDVQRNQAF